MTEPTPQDGQTETQDESAPKNAAQRFRTFKASKGLLVGSCLGCVVATLAVGFSLGGWQTASEAESMATKAAAVARSQLVADVCAARFMDVPDAAAELAEFNEIDMWDRPTWLSNEGWTILKGMERPEPGAAFICAQKLGELDAAAVKS